MNSTDYYNKLDAIINDESKFVKVPIPDKADKHPVIVKEKSIKYYIDKYVPDLNKSGRKSLIPVGSAELCPETHEGAISVWGYLVKIDKSFVFDILKKVRNINVLLLVIRKYYSYLLCL